MTASTCCCSLSSYTKLDSLIVVSGAADCHLIVKRMFCECPAHKGQWRTHSSESPHRLAPQFHPTFIVPIAARPFHPEHPAYPARSLFLSSNHGSRRRQSLNALFLVFSVCSGPTEWAMAPRWGTVRSEWHRRAKRHHPKAIHDSPPRLNLYPLAAGQFRERWQRLRFTGPRLRRQSS